MTAPKALPFVELVTRVLRVRLTPAQRVLASVAFDGVEPAQLGAAARELAAKLFGPVDDFPAVTRKVLLVKKGARVGGSWIFGALYSLWRALTAELSGLAPGEHATALIVAPDTRLGRQVLRYAIGAAKETPSIADKIESETSDSFVLRRSDGRPVVIEVLPATRGGSALRGRSLVSAVLSEASFFRDESAAVNDVACFTAVAPRILRGGMVVIESTPWAEQGLVFDLFTNNWGTPATCIAADAPTLLMRPDPETAETVERERLRDPDNAAREFDAQFMSGGSSLYFGAELASALDRDLSVTTTPRDGATVTIGGDIGLARDASAFCAVHRLGEHLTLADLIEMRPKRLAKGQTKPLSLRDVVHEGCEFAQRHGQRVIHVDNYVLVPAREHLPQGFQLKAVGMANEHKAERYRLLKENLRNELVHIPGALVRVVTQLADVVAQPGAGGIVLIKHPRRQGSHGDAAAAFVIAASQGADRVRGGAGMVRALQKRLERERLQQLERAAGLRS